MGLQFKSHLGQPFQNQRQQDEGPTLLQLSTLIHSTRDSERQTTVSVAHEQWPLPSDFSVSSENLPDEPATMGSQLLSGCSTLVLPAYIECMSPGTSSDIQEELRSWGIDCQAFRFGATLEGILPPLDMVSR